MTCQACGGELTRYDEYRSACRKCGQLWTLAEHADKIREIDRGSKSEARLVRVVPVSKVPAWLPGAVLGGLALLVSVLEVIL